MDTFLIGVIASVPCVVGIELFAMSLHYGQKQDALIKVLNRQLHMNHDAPVETDPLPRFEPSRIERRHEVREAILR